MDSFVSQLCLKYYSVIKDFHLHVVSEENNLASLPGHSCLQFLITCSMQNGGGRPGRKSHVHSVR